MLYMLLQSQQGTCDNTLYLDILWHIFPYTYFFSGWKQSACTATELEPFFPIVFFPQSCSLGSGGHIYIESTPIVRHQPLDLRCEVLDAKMLCVRGASSPSFSKTWTNWTHWTRKLRSFLAHKHSCDPPRKLSNKLLAWLQSTLTPLLTNNWRSLQRATCTFYYILYVVSIYD